MGKLEQKITCGDEGLPARQSDHVTCPIRNLLSKPIPVLVSLNCISVPTVELNCSSYSCVPQPNIGRAPN